MNRPLAQRVLSIRLVSLITLTGVLLGCQSLSAKFRDASEEWGFAGDGKAAFVDFNNDGWIDLCAGGKLYRNEAGKKLVLVEGEGLPGGETIWADYDNDGHLDAFSFVAAGSLHHNLGNGSFEKVPFPQLPTVNSRGAVWLDVNNDGYLDLYVGGYEIWQKAVHPDAIYLNQQDGTFKEHWRSADNAHYSARGVTAADYNEDGHVDVFVSNYRLQPNFLWKNDGKGTFANVAVDCGAAGNPSTVINYTGGISYPISGHTIGSAFGDLDDDGHIDLFVGNFAHPRPGQDHPQFLRNLGPEGSYKFKDRSAGAGLAWQESFASPALGDFDNDGDLDLYFTTVYGTGSGGIKNYPVLYRNEGNWKFVNVTAAEGIGNLGATYQAAWGDLDNDGDLDLVTNGKLFINEGNDHSWIQLRLDGGGSLVNRSAVGAIVRLTLGERILTRHVETGTGEGNQNQLRLHFGLGSHQGPVVLDIRWPGGSSQKTAELAPNQVHRIKMP
jgi:hypothetical protein